MQLDAAEDEENANGTISRLAGGLLQDWSEGDMSAARLVFHVTNARRDGMNHVMIERLAAIGRGRHAQNGLREVLQLTGLERMQTQLPVPDAVTRLWQSHLSVNETQAQRIASKPHTRSHPNTNGFRCGETMVA